MYDEFTKSRAVDPGRKKISEIKKALKPQGFSEQEIVRNLDYLVQTRWIVRVEERYPIISGKRPVIASQAYFKISNKGIDYKGGPSKFQVIERFQGINVSAVGSVVVLGGNNVVNVAYTELYGALGILSDAVKASDKISDEQKLNSQAEIETIKDQLAKTKPDHPIIQRAWEGFKAVATIEGVAAAAARVYSLLAPFLGG